MVAVVIEVVGRAKVGKRAAEAQAVAAAAAQAEGRVLEAAVAEATVVAVAWMELARIEQVVEVGARARGTPAVSTATAGMEGLKAAEEGAAMAQMAAVGR